MVEPSKLSQPNDPRSSSHDVDSSCGLQAEYGEWIDRLRATAQSVAFCCRYKLGDRESADAVGARVVAGLIGRPAIFRYFGLPYSGRVARHTERGIEFALSGEMAVERGWDALERDLREVATEHRRIMVHAWINDRPDEELATLLGCGYAEAVERKGRSLRFWETLSNNFLAEDRV